MGDDNTNNNTREDTPGKLGDEVEDTISLREFLQQSDDWEDTATAVLGGSDRQQCSYDQGYVKRQALYACLTCNPLDSDTHNEAGICLACSLKCHRGHDLVELYTKRNFRCDCGNKKFSASACHCQLQPLKSDYNTDNKYDHNFRGLYCICSRPYPDPEEDEEDGNDDEDSMIQCIVCEDWFHGRHTENDDVDLDGDLIDSSDFICKECTKKCDFLAHYGEFMLKGTSIPVATTVAPAEAGIPEGASVTLTNGVAVNNSEDNGAPETNSGNTSNGVANEPETKVDEIKPEVTPVDCSTCFLDVHAADSSVISGGTWWLKDWRLQLCKCEKCMAKYQNMGVAFLVDPEDPLEVYEAHGREKVRENPMGVAGGELETLFGEMDRVKQIEVVHAFNEMKEGLSEMVERVNAAGRPLSREDVQVFFEALRNKRRRLDVYVPDNCR